MSKLACGWGHCPLSDPDLFDVDDEDIDVFLVLRRNRDAKGRKFLRFMSYDEFSALFRGDELVNERDHSEHAHTNSNGFCFLPTDGSREQFWRAFSMLSHDVTTSYCVVFVERDAKLNKGWGLYPDPYNVGDSIVIDEYSTTSYSSRTMAPIELLAYQGEYKYPI